MINLRGFIEFIRRQGVVGLAIGFILGTAVSGVVESLVQDIINPVLGIILGSAGDLSEMTLKVGEAEIKWGSFVNILINFLIVAAVVYYGFKALGLEKLDLKEEVKEEAKKLTKKSKKRK